MQDLATVSSTAPPELICPISREVMQDPVTIVESGQTYSRAALLAWFAHSSTCPLTRIAVDPDRLVPNHDVAAAAADWLEQAGELQTECGDRPQVEPPSIANLLDVLRDPGADAPALLFAMQLLQKLAWENESNKVAIASGDGLASLLSLLSSAHNLVRWHAAEVLSLLALVDTLRDGVVDACVRSLQQHPLLLAHAAPQRGMGHMFRRPARRGPKGNAKRVSVLVSLLSNSKDEAARVAAAWALWVLSLDAGLRSSMLTARVVDSLVQMLSLSLGSASHFAAARLLRSLALADQGRVLFSHGAVAALVVTLHSGSAPGVQMAACSALCNIEFSTDAGIISLIGSLDAMAAVRALLSSDDPHWQGWAARFVRNLASGGQSTEDLVLPAGLVPPLVALLRSPDEHCQLTACSALYKLLECGPHLKKHFADQGLAEQLAGLASERSYPLKFVAARTMTELACTENYDAFCSPAVVSALEALLQEECEHCQYFSAVSLLNAGHAAGRIPLQAADCATFRGLIRLLASAGPQHRCAAAAVLRHLSRGDVNRTVMVKVGAIHALLEVVCLDEGRCPLEAAGALQVIARSGSYYRREVLDACSASASRNAGEQALAGGADPSDVPTVPYLLGCL